jgi:tagatose-1,6-bisphosphate aldolase
MADLANFLSKDGKFLMLALDHRGSFKKLMNPQNPDSVTDQMAIDLKGEIINAVKDQMSGVLIDPDYGLPAYVEKTKPFLLPVEKTGYEAKGGERLTKLEYGVPKLMEWGAGGAKILLFFNPYLETAEAQLETGKSVVDECKSRDYPLFLEIVTYEADHEVTMEEREKLVIESLKKFVARGVLPDVFKLEYPGSSVACRTISAILQEHEIPWILLTRGDSFEHFTQQLKDAVSRGAVGFLAGRALWQEVCTMQGEEKQKFLKETLPERFRMISDIVSQEK